MAAVYDGNNIGVLDGGTTFAALDTQALVAATPTAIVAADRGRVSTGIVNGTSDYLSIVTLVQGTLSVWEDVR